MAVVFEGFSIREYASKMRSIDVVKCWPFTRPSSSSSDDGDDNGNSKISKQTMESLLPPITVTKFRWWSEELDLLKSTELRSSSSSMEKSKLLEKKPRPRNQSDSLQVNLHVGEKSDERSDMLECPVCGAFAASTVNALNAHVDSCLAQASRQERRQMRIPTKPTKSRTPKKRSIAEIFAAAPQIHKLDDAPHEHESGSLERPRKKKKVAILKKLVNKRRKLKKKKNNKKGGLIANKENGSKLKLQTPVKFNRKANNTSCNRVSNAISILGEKPSLKCMSAKKKNKVVQASQLIVDHEKPSSTVRGVLKPGKRTSGQNAVICNLRATTQASTCGIQHSVRHVSFSGKDDILGPYKKHVASLEENICHVESDSFELLEGGHQNDGDKEFLTREINTSDGEVASFSTENGISVQAVKEKQPMPDIHYNVDIPKFLGPCTLAQENTNNFSDRSLPPDQVVLDSGNMHRSNQGNQTAFHSPPYAVAPRLLSAVKEIQNPFINSQVCGGVSATLNCSSQFIDYFGDRTQEVSISSKANPWASLYPSSSGFALSKNANETASFTSQFASQNVFRHALSHQPIYRPTSSELRGRLYPFPDCEQKEVALREKFRDEEFFGLPLNSLGELVQSNSNGKGGFDQLKKPSLTPGSSNSINNLLLPRSTDDHSMMKGKHFIESALPNYQLSLFHAQKHTKENATVYSSARLGATELQGHRKDGFFTNSERICSRFDDLMDSDINLMNISFSGCRQYDQFRNRKEKDMSCAMESSEKMFLSSAPTMRLMGKDVTICQSSDERRGYADAPKSTAFQNSCDDKHFEQEWLLDPASGKCKEAPVRQFEIARNQVFPRNVNMKPSECNFFQPSLNWQANLEFQNSSSIMNVQDPNPSSRHFAHPHTSHAIFDNGADFHESFVSRTEALRVSSRQPAVSASHRNYQNKNGSSVEFENNQNLPNAGKSSFNFPFLHPDHVEHVQPSWCRESSKSLIPRLLQATQQVQAHNTPQLFPEVGGRCCPHTARTSFLINHLVPRFPIVSYDHSSMISSSRMESSAAPLIPSLPVIKPTSVNLSQRNGMMFKDGMKSKIVSTQDLDISHKARKRPAVKEDYLMKPTKVTNLGIRDESRAATRLTRENFINDIQQNMGSLEIEPESDEASVGGWIPNKAQCNGFGLSAGIESSKVDSYGVTKLSPIKLSPGVKHILKPNQNADQDNSRLIHSTIHFASLTECGTKSKMIYRF